MAYTCKHKGFWSWHKCARYEHGRWSLGTSEKVSWYQHKREFLEQGQRYYEILKLSATLKSLNYDVAIQ
jgi:hypothetical protein